MKLSVAKIFPRPRAASAVGGLHDRILAGEVGLADLDLEQGVNRAVISGVMIDEPQLDRSRDGDPITVVLISFPAPDERAGAGSAQCEVEIRDELADRHREQLRLGATVLVVGELTGAGGLWADFLTAKSPT